MAAYRRVYDSRHLQADCKEPGSAAEPYARKSSTSHLYLDREAEYCDDRVCLCVRLCVYVSARAYLQKHTSDLYQIFAPPPDRRAEYCNGRVGLSVFVCVFVHDNIFGTTRPISNKFFLRVTYGRGSVLLRRRSDTLCTSGFMDDVIFVIFVHKPMLIDVAAQRKRSAHAALGLAINCAQ